MAASTAYFNCASFLIQRDGSHALTVLIHKITELIGIAGAPGLGVPLRELLL